MERNSHPFRNTPTHRSATAHSGLSCAAEQMAFRRGIRNRTRLLSFMRFPRVRHRLAIRSNTPAMAEAETFYEAVYRLVREIPRGRVMTYGQIATILGAPRAARAVGYAMRACGGRDVPWQRVINRKGQISARGRPEGAMLQREMLEAEGVEFNEADACDLRRYRWEPRHPDRFYYGPSANAPF